MASFLLIVLILTLHFGSEIFERLNNGYGLLITIIRLLAVFAGLVILWLVTANLQRILKWSQKLTGQKTLITSDFTAEIGRSEIPIEEIMVAIDIALYLELEEEELSILTLRHNEQEISPWVVDSLPSTMRQP